VREGLLGEGSAWLVGERAAVAFSSSTMARVVLGVGDDADAAVSLPWFLAAARTMVGPPMSMFSMASSSVQSFFATVCANG
jgi:hypothetical protein